MIDSASTSFALASLFAVAGITALVALLLSYLAGSVPFGYVLVRVTRGIDIREQGSGNIGATNVGRVLGRRWFVVVLFLDFLKGLLPVLMVRWLVAEANVSQEATSWYTARGPLEVLCGSAAIVGHLWPLWLGFRGGKGVATSLGVIVVLAPWATLVAFLAWCTTVAATRYVSLGSMLAAVSFAAWQVAWIARSPETLGADRISLLVFSVVAPVLVLVRHRTNLVRLLKGTELRIGASPKSKTPDRKGPMQE
jgi:glycerol-3-phosphate acyltransferase PlsY